VFLDWKELPWHWTLSDSFVATLFLIILVPAVVSGVFGYFAFRSRIKGVYFSIITQAMTFAAMLLFFRNNSIRSTRVATRTDGTLDSFIVFPPVAGRPASTRRDRPPPGLGRARYNY
jgi:ABC-type branched-subunit amino acid transport system permease subunit